MHCVRLCYFIFIVFFVSTVQGQCFDKDSIRKIFNLKENPTPAILRANIERLKELRIRLKECPTPSDSVHSYLLRQIGVRYYQVADYLNAIAYTKQSIDLVKSGISKNSVNKRDLVFGYYYLQIYYDSLKQENARMNATDSCIYFDLKYNTDYFYTCLLLYEKVKHLFRKGDYEQCIYFASLGEGYIKNYYHYADSIDYAAAYLTYKIDALFFSNKLVEAEKLLENKLTEYNKAANKDALGTIYNLLGLVSEYKGDFKTSIGYFQKAYVANLKIGYKKGCAQSLARIGILQTTKLQQPLIGLSTFRKALLSADKVDSLFLLSKMAIAWSEQNGYDSALFFFDKAFLQIGYGVNENNLISDLQFAKINNNYAEYVVGLILDKADVLLNRYRVEKNPVWANNAIRTYKAADKLLRRMRAEHAEVRSTLSWRHNTRRLYEHAIAACFEAGVPDEAFYFFENSRAVVLNDRLIEQHLLNESDIVKLAQANKNILRLKRATETLTANELSKAQSELLSNVQEKEKLLAAIKLENPLYFQSFLDSSEIVIGDVQNSILREHSVIVEIFAGDSAIYTLTISNSDFKFKRIPKGIFDSLTNAYLAYLSDRSQLNANFASFIDVSNKLYKLLFTDPLLPAGRIIISPGGKYIPVEALVVGLRNGRPVYFLEEHAVSYAYSVRYLLNPFSPSQASYQNFFGVAPVTYSYNKQLATLKGSEESLQRIATGFNSPEIILSSGASKQGFMNKYGSYKIVQLYTHASDSSDRSEPVIWFADSALYLSDLISEKRPITRLIVLSACQTGTGLLYQGEGVFNFNRGFAALGIPSAITNLWSVDSKATYRLTELFYKFLSDGHPSDIALQKAKLELMRSDDNSLPFFWAAPILAGKAEVIELRNSTYWWWLGLGLIAIILFGLFWSRRNRWNKSTT